MMSWPSNIKDIEAQGQSYETKQIIFLVAGGVAAVTGTVIYIVGRSKKPSQEGLVQLVLAPTATPDTVGVSLSGGF